MKTVRASAKRRPMIVHCRWKFLQKIHRPSKIEGYPRKSRKSWQFFRHLWDHQPINLSENPNRENPLKSEENPFTLGFLRKLFFWKIKKKRIYFWIFSAGIGRTGVFIALDMLLDKLAKVRWFNRFRDLIVWWLIIDFLGPISIDHRSDLRTKSLTSNRRLRVWMPNVRQWYKMQTNTWPFTRPSRGPYARNRGKSPKIV